MDKTTARAIKRMDRIATLIEALPEIGAQEYANGRLRAKPIVDRHFTAGNQQRYGWAPLSPDYAEQKRGQRKMLQRGMKAAGRPVSRLDEDDLGGSILPMLVRTGRMRAAVNSRTHRIIRSGDVAVIVFANLPEYALAHHKGGAHLPKRSPVAPNIEDRAEVVKVMQRQLDVAIGTGGDVPVSARSIPGRARVG
ncbi:hypothetical protein [Methylibium sp.]|uniref:hypothetical protein n=1 Tax=Methylibium sp. TaxID=2067992 RepID=UPI0018243857|nr:hypothetical protein [Methylibium sp.]MBA3588849.1 hypothetical protein [Methylibium sp.]